MSRDPLARMDVDTRWAYHRKMRALQRLYPQQWPIYWCAYLALLGEAWANAKRSLTLEQTWVPVMPCSVEDAKTALIATEIVDAEGRIPLSSWREWVEPALKRLRGKSDEGLRAAHDRWHLPTPFEQCVKCAKSMGTHRGRNTPRPPRQPSTPSTPRAPRARGKDGLTQIGGNGRDDRAERIARAQAILDNPSSHPDVKAGARSELHRLGATA